MKYPTREIELKADLMRQYIAINPKATENDVRRAGYGDAVDFYGTFENAVKELRKGMTDRFLGWLLPAA